MAKRDKGDKPLLPADAISKIPAVTAAVRKLRGLREEASETAVKLKDANARLKLLFEQNDLVKKGYVCDGVYYYVHEKGTEIKSKEIGVDSDDEPETDSEE